MTVKFLASKLTLQTHLQNQIIGAKVRNDNQKTDILAGLKNKNPLLVLGELFKNWRYWTNRNY
ncbi:hypothetical protein P344_04110 [Spiroplasma mirum ATCC 29335]|uniref:Uncharacterized protein n=1 Tax=Spiroplasma mirum ATCC 29335 TaxID=838561 RepID=W0GR57_9MOLU|nr:hypothetical protein SMM_0686 [Spiroplasma mirum ATCC 29335]AHI58150.1 hypothetical protein P344_04110 [Spiroplasma mirum ATCC 29335]